MKRSVIEAAGFSVFAEVGIVIFMVVFFLVVLKGFLMPKEHRDLLSALPLSDSPAPQDEVGNE